MFVTALPYTTETTAVCVKNNPRIILKTFGYDDTELVCSSLKHLQTTRGEVLWCSSSVQGKHWYVSNRKAANSSMTTDNDSVVFSGWVR